MEVGSDKEEGQQPNTTTLANQENQKMRNSSRKGKSCKGTLYYSSILKSKGRHPRCIGFSRTLQQVPSYTANKHEVEASKEGQSLTYFRYACLGYSVYLDIQDGSSNGQKPRAELPGCVGIEVYHLIFQVVADKRVPAAEHSPAHAHSHAYNREDDRGFLQPRPHNSAHRIAEEFLRRFSRNANLVASGVARNLSKVGSYIKDSVDDILYPHRRRSK